MIMNAETGVELIDKWWLEYAKYQWDRVDTSMIKLSQPANQPACPVRAELMKQMPYLHFWQAWGLYGGKMWCGNGFTPLGAFYNMEAGRL
jgi:hypothetical protein